MTSDGTLHRRPGFARWVDTCNTTTAQFLAGGARANVVNLGGGLPDPRDYPLAEIEAATSRALARFGSRVLDYGPIPGLPELREAIAARTLVGGHPVSVDNVMITSGSMQALDLVGKALLDQGDVIAAQSPTYLGAIDAWRPREPSYRLLDVARGDAADPAKLAGAKFAYVVPNFSNPTGALVDAAMRDAILRAAHESGTWLVEDDPYGSLFLDGPPIPRILEMEQAALDGVYCGPVIYMGTFSKSLAPGLRIGWVVAAPEMIQALIFAKQGADLSTSCVTQAAAVELLESDLLERHREHLVASYRRRRDAICDAAERHLRPWFTWERPAGGMFLWLVARDPALDTDRVREVAYARGLILSPGSSFHPTGEDRTALRLNFTLNDEPTLRRGIEVLAAAAEQVAAENAAVRAAE